DGLFPLAVAHRQEPDVLLEPTARLAEGTVRGVARRLLVLERRGYVASALRHARVRRHLLAATQPLGFALGPRSSPGSSVLPHPRHELEVTLDDGVHALLEVLRELFPEVDGLPDDVFLEVLAEPAAHVAERVLDA